MSLTPKSYNLLLEVFYFGLKWGLITKADIVKWADNIIMAAEEDLDYFFIELSMSSNINETMALIKEQIIVNNAPIVGRVLLGLIYHQLNNNAIELKRACDIMDRIALHNTITGYEIGSLYQFSDELQKAFSPEHFNYLHSEILEFLSSYKDFTVDNYDMWPTVNEQIETLIFNITQRAIEAQEAYDRAQKHAIFINRFTIKMILYILILTAEIVIITKPDLGYKFNEDLYTISLIIFGIAMCYPMVWVVYRALNKLFRI
jgi:hypothetical protein